MPLLAANLISTHHDLALSLCLITQKIDRCSRHQGQRMRTLSDLNHTINSRHPLSNGRRNNWLFKHDLKSECLTDRTKFSGTIGDKDGRKGLPGDAKASRGSKATCIVLYSSPPHETTTMFMLFLAASQSDHVLGGFRLQEPTRGGPVTHA